MRGIAAESCPRLVASGCCCFDRHCCHHRFVVHICGKKSHIVQKNTPKRNHDLAMLFLRLLSDGGQCGVGTAFEGETVRLVIWRHDGGVGILVCRSGCFCILGGRVLRVLRR